MGAFGEKLRKQREQRGIALDAISNTTKISPRMLRALEEEHFDQLPGGVFNKGFVRAYARQVGLDEEEAVTDYLAALSESQIRQQSILPDFRAAAGKPSAAGAPDLRSHELPGNDGNDHSHELRGEDHREKIRENKNKNKEGLRDRPEALRSSPDSTSRPAAHPPARRPLNRYPAGSPAQDDREPSAHIPWAKLAAPLLLATLLLVFLNLRHNRNSTAASSPVTAPNQLQVPAPATPPRRPSGSTASLTVGKPPSAPLSAGTLSPGTISTATTSSGPTPILPGTATSSKAAASPGRSPAASTTGSAAPKLPANPPAATTNPPPAKIKSATAALKPPSTFTLLIRADKNTWVSIVADGKPVAEETLIAPAHTSVRASHEVVVRTGNAAGISFLLNGKEIPAQGNDGEVKTYVFDATGIR